MKKILSKIQYIIAISLLFFFVFGLFPSNFAKVGNTIILLLLIQIFITVIRIRVLMLILEFLLLLFAFLSMIPFLGFLFKLIAIFLLFFEIAFQKNVTLQQNFKVHNFKNINFNSIKSEFRTKTSKKKSKKKKEVVDVDFEEK